MVTHAQPSIPRRSGGSLHFRGYVPHFDRPGLVQFVTFRLADALPAAVVAEMERESTVPTGAPVAVGAFARLETYLDAGHGACFLRDPRVAEVLKGALEHFDGTRYRMFAWTIMPNHVHAILEVGGGSSLSSIMHTWKSFTANRANQLLHRTGSFWQPDYFDRVIRDEEHLRRAAGYILVNPVKAGLAANVHDWPYSHTIWGYVL